MIIIDNNQQSEVIIEKMLYTTGGDFFLSGTNYIGYINIVNSIPFEGKSDQTQILQPSRNIRSLINLDDKLFFDRTVSDTLTLPYNKQDIRFQPNEIINRNSFNHKLNLLYNNFKELYKFSEMSIPNIPRNFTGFVGISGAGKQPPYKLGWVEGDIITDDFVPFTTYNANFKGTNEYFNLFINNEQDNITIFFSVSNTIFVYDMDNPLPGSGDRHTRFNFVLSANTFGNYGELIFGDISNTTDDGDKILYVADRLKNSIYKFDVSSLVNVDRTGIKEFRLIDTIGGTGSLESNFDFIEKIEYGKDYLFVYDKARYEIKKFTKELNYVSSYINKKFFAENVVVDISFNTYNNQIFILTDTFKILVINATDLTYVTTYIFDESTLGPGRPNRFLISTNNSNIYYLQTTRDIFKGHINKLKSSNNSIIGTFKITANVNFDRTWDEYIDPQYDYWETAQDEGSTTEKWDSAEGRSVFNFLGLENLQLESNFEKIYTITDRSILEFTENALSVSMLSDVRPKFFDISEIEIKDDYFNAFNYNSSLYKLAFNLNLLSANISKYLTIQYKRGRKEFYSFSNIDPDVVDSVKLIDQNELYAGVNEIIDTSIFNRTVEKIYDYQELILKAYFVKILNTRIPALSNVVF